MQIDVDSTVMESATDNTITRNKQTNTMETMNEAADTSNSESKAYQWMNYLKQMVYLKKSTMYLM